MLDTLDVLIGFTVVMLVVSMAVTMITQAIASGLANLRGWCLKQGVSRLLALMDQGLKLPEAKKITDHVLRNPLVGRARMPLPKIRGAYGLGTVIHREELIRLLLDFAIPGDAEKANLHDLPEEELLRHKFRASLARNGIEDPEAVLQAVRTAVVELEKSNPELSHSARITIALLNFAASNFLGKFNTWFDQTMDRVSELFTRRIRAITTVVAVLLALALQLDSIGLINRLSVDDELRNRLVETAVAKQESWREEIAARQAALDRLTAPATPDEAGGNAAAAAENGVEAAPDSGAETEAAADAAADGVEAAPDSGAETNAAAPAAEPGDAEADRPDETAAESEPAPAEEEDPLVEARRTLEELGVVSLPSSPQQWAAAWRNPPDRGGGFRWAMLFGILLSAALLSLGAPFWFSVLANLLKLRSTIARKDEVERTERQTTQAAPAGAATGANPLPPALAGGERGDLTATG